MSAAKRLNKELEGLTKAMPEMPWLLSASPKDDDLFSWEAVLKGPESSPYEVRPAMRGHERIDRRAASFRTVAV